MKSYLTNADLILYVKLHLYHKFSYLLVITISSDGGSCNYFSIKVRTGLTEDMV